MFLDTLHIKNGGDHARVGFVMSSSQDWNAISICMKTVDNVNERVLLSPTIFIFDYCFKWRLVGAVRYFLGIYEYVEVLLILFYRDIRF